MSAATRNRKAPPLTPLCVNQFTLRSHLPHCASRRGSPERLSCFCSNTAWLWHTGNPCLLQPGPGKERTLSGDCHYGVPSPSSLLKSSHLHFISPFAQYLHWATEKRSSSGHLPLTGIMTRILTPSFPSPWQLCSLSLGEQWCPFERCLSWSWSRAPALPTHRGAPLLFEGALRVWAEHFKPQPNRAKHYYKRPILQSNPPKSRLHLLWKISWFTAESSVGM